MLYVESSRSAPIDGEIAWVSYTKSGGGFVKTEDASFSCAYSFFMFVKLQRLA